MDDYRKFVEKNLTDMDYLEEKSKFLKSKEEALRLLRPENEGDLRKFFAEVALSLKEIPFGLERGAWVVFMVSRLRKDKKNREEFVRDWFGS